MKVGLVVHPVRDSAADTAAELVKLAAPHDMELVAVSEDAREIPGVAQGDIDGVDLVISIGGDGTVLEAVQQTLASQVPVLGVNLGRIGFLAEVERTHLAEALDRVAAGQFIVEERMTLKAIIDNGPTVHGLNDVVISKRVSQRLAPVAVEIDGRPFRTYRADGIVVATPTGSTAYSFSAGGPAVAPMLEVLIMSAVAPHSLFSRSLVFEPDRVLRFVAVTDRPVGVEVDASDLGELAEGQAVSVRRGDFPARFATLGGERFPHILKHKLGLE